VASGGRIGTGRGDHHQHHHFVLGKPWGKTWGKYGGNGGNHGENVGKNMGKNVGKTMGKRIMGKIMSWFFIGTWEKGSFHGDGMNVLGWGVGTTVKAWL